MSDHITDHWSMGYRAGMNGATYADNPLEGQHGADAWAFGCSEGMKERNRLALGRIIEALAPYREEPTAAGIQLCIPGTERRPVDNGKPAQLSLW